MTFKLLGLMTLILAILSGVFYWYYNDTQKKMAELIQEKAAIETSSAVCKNTVESLQRSQTQLNNELVIINNNFAEIRKQNNVLATKLEKHDIGVLGAAKPNLVEKIINNAVNKSSRCIELLSGSPLTEKEKAATSARSFNSECPWLWPGEKK